MLPIMAQSLILQHRLTRELLPGEQYGIEGYYSHHGERKLVQRHCTSFLICDWPWLHYLRHRIDCCSVYQCRLLYTKQRWYLIGKATSKRTDISCLGHQCSYHYFSDDTTYAVLFGDIITITYWNLIKNVGGIFEKIAIFCFGTHLKGPYFWSWNVHIHQALTYDG
jgi:hypothetical protein